MSDEYKPGLIGQIKDKLITSKQQWAKDGRLLTGETSHPINAACRRASA